MNFLFDFEELMPLITQILSDFINQRKIQRNQWQKTSYPATCIGL